MAAMAYSTGQLFSYSYPEAPRGYRQWAERKEPLQFRSRRANHVLFLNFCLLFPGFPFRKDCHSTVIHASVIDDLSKVSVSYPLDPMTRIAPLCPILRDTDQLVGESHSL